MMDIAVAPHPAATDAGFTSLGPVTEESAMLAVCALLLSELAVVSPFLDALAEAAERLRSATAVGHSYL